MIDLHGKTALVTGASSGIGQEIARLLAREVGTLVLVARRHDRLDTLAAALSSVREGLRVLVRPVDLIDRPAAHALLDALEQEGEHIDVLINNAGFGDYEFFERSNWRKIEQMIDLNVMAATILLHRLVPPMVDRGFGAILNVGSTAGMIGMPQFGVYAATKAYLNHLSDVLHAELSGTGVTVTALCPGPVPTEFSQIARNRQQTPAPAAFIISAADCAEQAIDAMKRGHARVIPGVLIRTVTASASALPAGLLRAVMSQMAKRSRQTG